MNGLKSVDLVHERLACSCWIVLEIYEKNPCFSKRS